MKLGNFWELSSSNCTTSTTSTTPAGPADQPAPPRGGGDPFIFYAFLNLMVCAACHLGIYLAFRNLGVLCCLPPLYLIDLSELHYSMLSATAAGRQQKPIKFLQARQIKRSPPLRGGATPSAGRSRGGGVPQKSGKSSSHHSPLSPSPPYFHLPNPLSNEHSQPPRAQAAPQATAQLWHLRRSASLATAERKTTRRQKIPTTTQHRMLHR